MLSITPSRAMRDEVNWLGKVGGQMRFAAALALTRTAQQAKRSLEAEMPRAFDRPTRWTLRSLYLRPATKERQEARVWIKNGAGWKTTPPERYMRPNIYGGARSAKRSEVALRRIGVLPPGMFTVPAAGAQLDRHGNMSRGQIVRILSYFRAFGEQGYRANITAKRRASMMRPRGGKNARPGESYFALPKPRGNLKPGIYQRFHFAHGNATRPVMLFIKQPMYTPRFDFFGIGQRVVSEHLDREFTKALDHALRTMR